MSVSVPTLEEAVDVYGVNLARHGMQPVWVEVTNDGDQPAWLLPSGLDPEYFSASEAAYPFVKKTSAEKAAVVESRFRELQFRNPVPPGGTVSGFFIVNRDEGVKAVDIDIISREKSNSFTFMVVDPTFQGDYTTVDFEAIYESSEIIDIDDPSELLRAVEKLPVCTNNKKGDKEGDPLNLALIGDPDDIFPAFVRRGWHPTEIISTGSLWRTTKSFLSGSRYRYSPVSPLYVFGRRQDIALQKARGSINERNHLRLWSTPLRFRGQTVWVGQISRDIGVKFTMKSPTISTHVIDPDVDEARRYLIEDLAYSQSMARLVYVQGVGELEKSAPRYNLVGDPYYTDGYRAVIFLEQRPYSLDEIVVVDGRGFPGGSETDGKSNLGDE